MKQVKLSHFFKRLAARGVNMTGCKLYDHRHRSTYEFMKMDGNNVMVRYGQNMDRTGAMSAWLRVDGLVWSPTPGNKVRSIQDGAGGIVVQFSDMVRGNW